MSRPETDTVDDTFERKLVAGGGRAAKYETGLGEQLAALAGQAEALNTMAGRVHQGASLEERPEPGAVARARDGTIESDPELLTAYERAYVSEWQRVRRLVAEHNPGPERAHSALHAAAAAVLVFGQRAWKAAETIAGEENG